MNNQQTSKKPRILILGSTGRTGKAVIGELKQRSDSVQIVYSSRDRAQVDAWRQEGKDAVFLDHMWLLSILASPVLGNSKKTGGFGASSRQEARFPFSRAISLFLVG